MAFLLRTFHVEIVSKGAITGALIAAQQIWALDDLSC